MLEKKVFDKLDQERMLKAPNREAAFKVLFDTDLGNIASKENDLEKIFEEDLAALKATLAGILEEEKRLFFLLFLKFDGLNVKLASKKILKGEDLQVNAFPWGLVPYDKIEEKVAYLLADKIKSRERPKGALSEINFLVEEIIKKSVGIIKTVPEAAIDSQKIEAAVDRAYFETKLEIAGQIDSFLLEIIKVEVDISNLKGLLKGEKEEFEFIKGGSLKEDELKKLILLREGEIFQDLKKFLEVFGLSLLLERFAKDKSETALENGLNSFVAEKIFEKEKETGTGISKILAFFYKKVNAQNNIRLIIFGKENNILPEEIEKCLLPV